jgi:integrase
MKANGEDIKTIQELLRHATFKVTADTYTQAVTPVKRDAQARIAKLIMADGAHQSDHADSPITIGTQRTP